MHKQCVPGPLFGPGDEARVEATLSVVCTNHALAIFDGHQGVMKNRRSECYNDRSANSLRLPLDRCRTSERQVFSSALSDLLIRGELEVLVLCSANDSLR